MKFSRLRLVGFKSFVEPTELMIEPGLTGVVGPNGCGKSNLLEALRWVMGENSHKNMRASGMDDVIFSGTTKRPPRNMAEVTLTLDNGERRAPIVFNDTDTIEVSRRIERQAGSTYLVNGREVRARDVQLLFADASTGARSPALVRQGQVSELINARPEQRRRILEEAAGITGLYTRRHEAELRLNGAEANLTRLDDVIGQLETQFAALKRQARQAQRYRLLSAEIRRLEAAMLYRAWADASNAAREEESRLRQALTALGEATRAHAAAERERNEAEVALPQLREAVTVRAAVVQRLRHEQGELKAEETLAETRHKELKGQLQQIEQDLGREQDLVADSDAVLGRLTSEEAALRSDEGSDDRARADAQAALKSAAERMAKAQEAADQGAARHSEIIARRGALERNLADLNARAARLVREHGEASASLAQLQRDDDEAARFEALKEEHAALLLKIEAAEQALRGLEEAIRGTRGQEAAQRSSYEQARRRADTLSTEVRTLTKLLKVSDDELWPPMLDAVKVETGFEQAVAAAFGEDLDAAADTAAPVHWASLPPFEDCPGLPAGAQPLANHVEAPAAMARSLAAIGVVAASDGSRLQPLLRPGQSLVSRQGDLWRWDGYTSLASAPSPAAVRLAERNRLASLTTEAEQAEREANASRTALDRARAELEALQTREQSAREELRTAQRLADGKRDEVAALERRMAERSAKLDALQQLVAKLAGERDEVAASQARAAGELEQLERPDTLKAELDQLRAALADARAEHAEARTRHDGLEREARLRVERLQSLTREREAWQARTAKAAAQIEILEGRATKARQSLAELATVPARIEERRRKLMTVLSDAEAQERTARSALDAGENGLREAERTFRAAAEILAAAREEHARSQAKLDAGRARVEECAERIADALGTAPEGALRAAGVETADELPDPRQIGDRLAQLKGDRERLGGVNLRAEEEAQAVEAQLKTLVAERDDVIEAINKLRQGIQSLNREGRQRLLDAFDVVNAKFQDLFATLFGGGQAELRLVESDDPLEAGLEIMANPPGKRPQVLSLLSGGEQALTAIALIFAVFLTNPSPICVMDEVDAPLDDANVERFCNLLDAMLTRADTRFLVITHHPVTMARMHRLFGVTMVERGVSQLVSVDLDAAEAMREVG
ncbi:chromosome segregation protein SMC [Rhodoligotrophos defluvii]|uniref:chromosome segregation protein SMC n=1 Tax=Rhodoligotrophos defluvii TaxID=2561934 RepID=UPI0010C980E5|nr:chromosome segregation protein SMC [Rhodoligotrophos defluvii]